MTDSYTIYLIYLNCFKILSFMNQLKKCFKDKRISGSNSIFEFFIQNSFNRF